MGPLAWGCPPGLVDHVVAVCGRMEQRRRLPPARLVVCFVLALALSSPAPYLDVMRHLVEGLRSRQLMGDWRTPENSSLLRARQRPQHGLELMCAGADGPLGGDRHTSGWTPSRPAHPLQLRHYQCSRSDTKHGAFRLTGSAAPWRD
ncbi:transposase domain-containing protein [Streptomyces chrestomyceticus]|uniref:transposase domain-containing protein n=1 Tax=Streptomyces chrestomyceticus TaxID=68185 RepID=UPI0033DEAB93